MISQVDKIIDALIALGPLGILCALLLLVCSGLITAVVKLFNMLADLQEKRHQESITNAQEKNQTDKETNAAILLVNKTLEVQGGQLQTLIELYRSGRR